MRKFVLAAATAALAAGSVSAQSETAPQDVAPTQSFATRQGPKIHLVAVVDASGCKGLNGGIMSGGGSMLGGLLAHKAGAGGLGIRVAGEAGKQIGNMYDKAQRCRQEIKVDPGVAG